MDGASGGREDVVQKGCVDDNNDNNSTQVREEDDACSEVETEEGALASSEGYSADYSESISSGSSSSSDRRESRDKMGHVHTKDGGDEGGDIAAVKATQKKLDAASPSRNDPNIAQRKDDISNKRRYSASNIEQNAHRHRHKHHQHNKEPTQDMNRQMDEIMNLYNVR